MRVRVMIDSAPGEDVRDVLALSVLKFQNGEFWYGPRADGGWSIVITADCDHVSIRDAMVELVEK